MDEVAQDPERISRGHERSDVPLRPFLIFGLSLATLAGLSLLAMWFLLNYFASRQARLGGIQPPLFDAQHLPPEPRLQVSPQRDLQAMLAAQRAILHSYGWVDRQAAIVRMPIERAIELLTERGLPTWEAATHGSRLKDRGLETKGQTSKVEGAR
jgi:hypothetical protein